MIEHSQHDSERALSKFLDNFVAVSNMLIVAHDVFLLVVVEAVVSLFVDLAVGCASSMRLVSSVTVLLSLSDREEIDGVEFEDLTSLNFPQVGSQDTRSFFGGHREADIVLALCKHGGSLSVLADGTHLG